MSSSQPPYTQPSGSSRSIRVDIDSARPLASQRTGTGGSSTHVGGAERDEPLVFPQRHSPTLMRSFDPNDPGMQEHQRQMDVDSAMSMQRSRQRSGSVILPSPRATFAPPQTISESPSLSPKRLSLEGESYPFLSGNVNGIDLDNDMGLDGNATGADRGFVNNVRPPLEHLRQLHHSQPEPLVQLSDVLQNVGEGVLPLYQNSHSTSNFDFSLMEGFAVDERQKLGIASPQQIRTPGLSPAFPPSQPSTSVPKADLNGSSFGANFPQELFVPADASDGIMNPDSASVRLRQRKLSLSNSARPRPRRGGKMALFEGKSGAPPPSFGRPVPNTYEREGTSAMLPTFNAANHEHGPDCGPSALPPPLYSPTAGHDRPFRFSFYSNALSATIHARSLSELPAEGQSFEDLFYGLHDHASSDKNETRAPPLPNKPKNGESSLGAKNGRDLNRKVLGDDDECCTWWLDVLSPTDEEMKLLSKVFNIHPLTTEDIQMEEAREKIELFRNYYLVCFRSFDQDQYSPTYLEPLNMYIVVFREGILSFHFRPTPHPQNVRRRIKQLKDYISVTSDWISYALIDDITDAFGPLIQNIEYEVDSIDELVLILKEAEQSDMLRRIGTCRKKVMGLLRLMGNKADVVKGLAKRCNEQWSVAPKSDIGLYLSDIQDHLITMTQNLNHYEKILSRSHSNYLAQISIEMTDANNQINDVLSKLTALGTVLIPMNLVTGLWGMNVHVPGQDVQSGYTWFVSIIGGLVGFACIGGYLTYRVMVGRR